MSDEWKMKFVEMLAGSTLGQSRVDDAVALKEQHLPKRIYKYQRNCVESRDCKYVPTCSWRSSHQ